MGLAEEQRARFHTDQFASFVALLVQAAADKPQHAAYLTALLDADPAEPDALEQVPVPRRVPAHLAKALRADIASVLQYPPRLGGRYISLRVSTLEGSPAQAEYLGYLGWPTAYAGGQMQQGESMPDSQSAARAVARTQAEQRTPPGGTGVHH